MLKVDLPKVQQPILEDVSRILAIAVLMDDPSWTQELVINHFDQLGRGIPLIWSGVKSSRFEINVRYGQVGISRQLRLYRRVAKAFNPAEIELVDEGLKHRFRLSGFPERHSLQTTERLGKRSFVDLGDTDRKDHTFPFLPARPRCSAPQPTPRVIEGN